MAKRGRPRTRPIAVEDIEPVRLPTRRGSTLELMLAEIPDGREIALSFARQVALNDDKFRELMRAYDLDHTLDLGELCELYSIAPADFMANITRAAYPFMEESMKFAHAVSTQIVAKRLSKVVERGMIEGAKADGTIDRHFILQKEGFHIAPKGTNIHIQNVNAQAAGIPSLEEETHSLNDILATEEDHLLSEGTLDQDFLEAELEEEKIAV